MATLQTIPDVIPSPTVLPFNRKRFERCPACANDISFMERFVTSLKGGALTVCCPKYCAGGKEPTEQTSLAEALMRGSVEKANPCAGIYLPHLHITCKFCGFAELMAVQS